MPTFCKMGFDSNGADRNGHRKDQAVIQQSRLAVISGIIGSIVHQWQQPLNSVGLIIQTLQHEFHGGTLSDEQLDADIDAAMKVIMELSGAIEDFSDLFLTDITRQTFNIGEAVSSAVSLLSPTLHRHNIQVRVKSDTDMTVSGCRNEYIQVLLSIITNSCEAAIDRKISKPSISVSITSEKERTVVYVKDNCGGIANDVLPHIFDPYFTTRVENRAVGIGLYASRIIIEHNMGGALNACNVNGGVELRIETDRCAIIAASGKEMEDNMLYSLPDSRFGDCNQRSLAQFQFCALMP